MPIGRFSTSRPRVLADLPGSVVDLRALLALRAGGLEPRQRRRLALGAGLVLGLTVAAVVVPAYVGSGANEDRSGSVVGVLPAMYLGFLALAIVSAIASGGGREVVPREQAVAFPVSTWTEHFGALLLAPLNIAWLLQAWALLATTSYVLGPAWLPLSALPVLLWIVFATAVGQAVGWLVEGLRRGAWGVWVVRLAGVLVAVVSAWLVATSQVTDMVDRSPTVELLILASQGTVAAWGDYLRGMAWLVSLLVLGVMAGGVPARWALRRQERAEARLDSDRHRPRANPGGDLRALVRVDRASVWRSVPLRRGLFVLAVLPGLVAAAGALEWDLVTILPGLVASGGGLLFGVNAWSLDGRGALWRESLPVDQRLVFWSKAIVLGEILLASAALTIVLAAVRAGPPTSSELAATLSAAVVVTFSVVSACLRWSLQRPFTVDLRSARATPAPPVVMVGYSTRLALSTTMIGLVFSGAAAFPDPSLAVLLAMGFVAVSTIRLRTTARRWADPHVRARVVAVVAG